MTDCTHLDAINGGLRGFCPCLRGRAFDDHSERRISPLAGGAMAIHCDVTGCPGGGEPDAMRGTGTRVHLDVPPFCGRLVKPHKREGRDTSSTIAALLIIAMVVLALLVGGLAIG
jgi:hypothetical protein